MDGLINPNPIIHARKERVAKVCIRQMQRFPIHTFVPVLSGIEPLLINAICHPVVLQAAVADTIAGGREPIDAAEIFDHIRDITDPEHPYSLEQLHVVDEELITVDDAAGYVK